MSQGSVSNKGRPNAAILYNDRVWGIKPGAMNVIDESLWTASFLSQPVRSQLNPAVDKTCSEDFRFFFQIEIVRRMHGHLFGWEQWQPDGSLWVIFKWTAWRQLGDSLSEKHEDLVKNWGFRTWTWACQFTNVTRIDKQTSELLSELKMWRGSKDDKPVQTTVLLEARMSLVR